MFGDTSNRRKPELNDTCEWANLSENFKQFLNLLYLYFVCFYIFPITTTASCPFKNLPHRTTNMWILCAAFNAAIDLMHLTIEILRQSRYLPILIYFTGI